MPGKTVLITGCSAGGIGYSLAQEFQKRGLTVFATARNTEKMSGLEKLPNTTLLSMDITSLSSIATAVEEVKSRTGGKLDYLVNNAGQSMHTPMLDVDIKDAMKLFDVNFWGVLRTIRGFAPLLIEAKGTIVNIGSIVAYLPAPFGSVYNASKAAIHQFDDTLRIELAPLNVKVLTVVTGSIETNIAANATTPKLPSTSKYLAIEKHLDGMREGKRDYKMSSPADFAKDVVGDVLGGATGKIWRGANSSLTRWLPYVLPQWAIERLLANGIGFEKVGKAAL